MTDRRPAPGPGQWSAVLRALREARGVTQEGWAALLGVGRTTLQRWESGRVAPDVRAEEAIIQLCSEQGLFRTFSAGPLRGQSVTAEFLQQLLQEARLEGSALPAEQPLGQLLEDDEGTGDRRHDLRPGVTALGRSLDNDVVVEHTLVSRHHARIAWEAGRYRLSDLGSTNGTFLNGSRIAASEPLRDGDAIALGGLAAPRLVVYLPAEAVTTAAESAPAPD